MPVIMDNGSTNNTSQKVKKFNVKLIYEPKKGISYALNKGISEAKGKIIAVTNADTVVFPNWISNIYKAFKNNPNAIIVSGRVILIPTNFLKIIFIPELYMS